jgi:RTX calcium-binding nonapeptide repeat (4 copies)
MTIRFSSTALVAAVALCGLALGPSAARADADAAAGSCRTFPATIEGTEGDDVLIGTDGVDVIVGFGGNDVIIGGEGVDLICAGAGNDDIFGGFGDDRAVGGPGNDRVLLGVGVDVAYYETRRMGWSSTSPQVRRPGTGTTSSTWSKG